MTGGVRLDLNFPEFQEQLFDLDATQLGQAVKTLRKVTRLSWQQVYTDRGLHWEELRSAKGRFTIRVTGQCRAIVTREGDFMRFLALHFDHDSAYGRKETRANAGKRPGSPGSGASHGACRDRLSSEIPACCARATCNTASETFC